ncbi:glycoside hydrolase [Priestia megaterium]|uniref:glycoside hydrolase n=1 Tax=Priestia megaterium TaxID=1404 RepID=UPI000BEC3C00|nr:glycoside hydrolase [Priestia megaterium]PED63962.1 glycoside hydrolase [Priestia megaterium]
MSKLKFVTWTLHAPSTATFNTYKQLASTEPWYSANYTDTGKTTKEAFSDYRQRSFVEMIEENHEKIYSIGMHEFGVLSDGTMYNTGFTGTDHKVLTSYTDVTQADIANPVKSSLRYLMLKYPDIKWTIQPMCTSDNVPPVITNQNGAADTFIKELKQIASKYIEYGFPIQMLEIDFEKTNYSEAEAYKDFLVRVKNEACIPLGLELRVNMFAMTGDYVPSYYGWHDYRTLASGVDKNGNQAIDEFQLMTYDFSWGGSAPGPSTPLYWLKEVLDHVKDALPPEKTFIGNAGYGRRWPLSEQRLGVTFDYKQLMQAQNGMYVHNDGATADDGYFHFRDQDFIPFAGFNDAESDYQVTYFHVYDMFKAPYAQLSGAMQLPDDYMTNYSTEQSPLFTNIQKILFNGSSDTDDFASYGFQYSASNAGTRTLSTKIEGLSQTFLFRSVSKAKWAYNSTSGTCELSTGPTGSDGHITYTFDVPTAGNYKLIALVGFPYFGNDNFHIDVNGTDYYIGENLPDWYPFITNPSTHLYDCGNFDFSATGNTITIDPTNGAFSGGFIICEDYDQNMTGGKAIFPSNLQVMKRRGETQEDGNSEVIDAQFPEEMVLTGELLRRPPRPAIIWEDYFGPHLASIEADKDDITQKFNFYEHANGNFYTAGSGSTLIQDNGTNVCIDGYSSVGFCQGVWTVRAATDEIPAHTRCDMTKSDLSSAQLVLNKKMSCNVDVEADIQLEIDNGAYVGLRLLAQKIGEVGDSYLFLLDWTNNTVRIAHEKEGVSTTIYTADMTPSLILSKMDRLTLKAQIIDDKITCQVGDKVYFDKLDLPYPKDSGAHGVYMTETALKVYRLTIATLDRFEPMEKVVVNVDGQAYPFGEVERNVPYDEYGYLVYTGYAGNLTEAVKAIPADTSDDTATDSSEVVGRTGTIFETEVTPENWSLDYKNLQLATVPSWTGDKNVTIEFRDPGVWLRTFYIGDSKGYSVAYNSDKIGFIRTSQMVLDYNCKGIALWTLGQEDPLVFSYIDKVEDD